jgi:multidrug resistance protein
VVRERQPLPAGFATIWTAVALDLVGFGIVLPFLPRYAERFGATPVTVGLLVASFSLMQLVFSPLWGRVSDRYGRKPVLILSLVGTAVGSLITGLAGSLWLLFAGRIIDGISGASVSVAQAAVTDVAAPEQRARLLGFLGAAFGLGFVAGPAIGALAVLAGPELPFLLAAALAAVNAVVALRRLPETNPPSKRVLRPEEVEEDATARSGHSLAVLRLALVGFLSLVAFSAFEATFALLGERRFDLGESSTYLVFVGVGLVLVLVQGGLVHPVVQRLGELKALRAGLALDAVGLLLLAAARSWAGLVPALVVLIVGQGLVTPTLSSLVASRARRDRRGSALGVQQSAGGLARVVGPTLGGFLFQHVGFSAPSVAGAFLAAGAALLTLPLRSDGEQPAPDPAARPVGATRPSGAPTG